MDIRQLQYFVAVAEERHITRAAQRLRVAQPWLSQQVKTLERELGAALIDRRSRPLTLTDAGHLLLRSAHHVLRELQLAEGAVRRAGSGLSGEVHLGFTYGGLYDLLAPALAQHARDYPDVVVHLHQLPAAEQVSALRQQRVDLTVSRLVEPVVGDDLQVEDLRTERLIAILPDGHPALRPGSGADARPRTVALTDLAGEVFILASRHREPAVYDAYLHACSDAGFEPTLAAPIDDAQTQALSVAAGRGVALAGDGLSLRFPGLQYLTIEPIVALTRIALITPAGPQSPAAEHLIRTLSNTPTPGTSPAER